MWPTADRWEDRSFPGIDGLLSRVLRPFSYAFAAERRRPVVLFLVDALRRAAVGFATLPGRRPRLGARAPCVSSARCLAQKSFWKFLSFTLIVTVVASGFPHTSHTSTIACAIMSPHRQ